MVYTEKNINNFLKTKLFKKLFDESEGKEFFGCWNVEELTTDIDTVIEFLLERIVDAVNERIDSSYIYTDYELRRGNKVIKLYGSQYRKDQCISDLEVTPEIIVETIKPRKKTETYIVTKVDTNDADYVRNYSKIDNKEDLELVKTLINLVKNNSERNNFVIPSYDAWVIDGEVTAFDRYGKDLNVSEEKFYDLISKYFPKRESDGYYGYHTLAEAYIMEVKEQLL